MIKLNMSELLAFLQTLIYITRLSGRFVSFFILNVNIFSMCIFKKILRIL